MSRRPYDHLVNAGAFLVVLLFNWLANALPLGGRTTGAISDAYPSLFTPAGFTFAIWGLIYLLLAGFVIRQSLPSARDDGTLEHIDVPFRVNCLANASWIVAWHFDHLLLSLGIMLVILWSLVRIAGVLRADPNVQRGWSYLLIALPFSLYFGWISVATVANVSILQSAFGLNEWLMGEVPWTYVKLFVAGACAVAIGWRRSDAAYALVIAWGGYGIAAARTGHPDLRMAAQALSLFALAVAAAAVVIRLRRGIARRGTEAQTIQPSEA